MGLLLMVANLEALKFCMLGWVIGVRIGQRRGFWNLPQRGRGTRAYPARHQQ